MAYSAKEDKAPDKKRFNLHIPRQVLRQIIVSRILPGTIEWGRKLVDFAPVAGGRGVQLQFEGGDSVVANV